MENSAVLLSVSLGVFLSASTWAHGNEISVSEPILTARATQLPNTPPPGHTLPEPVQIRPARPPLSTEVIAQDQPALKAKPFDPVQARRDAQELATLAQQIPAAVDELSKNVLPRDLVQKLKQIEKLAKGLRREISR